METKRVKERDTEAEEECMRDRKISGEIEKRHSRTETSRDRQRWRLIRGRFRWFQRKKSEKDLEKQTQRYRQKSIKKWLHRRTHRKMESICEKERDL